VRLPERPVGVTAFHAAQIALAACAAAVVAARIRDLFFVAPLPVDALLRGLKNRAAVGDMEGAAALAARGGPAWVARVAGRALAAHGAGCEAEEEEGLEELLADLSYEATRGLWALRILARAASAAGLLGAVIAVLELRYGHGGLIRLVAGLPERIAMERALLSVLLGMATAGVCLYARGLLRRQALRLLADVRRVEDRVATLRKGDPPKARPGLGDA
jgi:biopolymer transport protein ExbB/TolQ